jgi:hypothetical protein
MTVQREIGDIRRDTEIKYSEIFNNCVLCSHVVDKSTDITATAQVCIFACVVSSNAEVSEELERSPFHSRPDKEI